MATKSVTDRYAVIGNPVAHSLSPRIHAQFAEQTGEAITYGKLQAPADGFVATASRFFDDGGQGMNITVPFKQEAFRFADILSVRAQLAEAVNTLVALPNGQREGENTDGAGLVRDLNHNHGLDLGAMRILVLGAGGAVRGVLAPLLSQSPNTLVVANRTASKAALLAEHFAVHGIGLDQTSEFGPFDLIINGTSAGLSADNPALPDNLFAAGACAYDMLYANTPTPFLQWASEQGASQCRDGLGMLVEQAAESFFLWRGKRPDTAAVIRALRPAR